jgi:hypothetical protein
MFTKMRDTKTFKYISNILKAIFSVVVILSVIGLPVFVIELLKGKNLNETFYEMTDGFKAIGGFYLVIILICIPFMLVGLLIDSAIKNKKGKAYQIVEFVNGASILILVLVGFYFVINGLFLLYKTNLEIFITVICAAAFAFYYWYKEKYT